MNKVNKIKHYISMKPKYNINNNQLVINLDCIYDIYNNQNKVKSIRKYVNNLLISNNIKFLGNKITIYKDGLLIGTFYLTNYYLNKINLSVKNNYLTTKNSYFEEKKYIEININNKIKKKKILELY